MNTPLFTIHTVHAKKKCSMSGKELPAVEFSAVDGRHVVVSITAFVQLLRLELNKSEVEATEEPKPKLVSKAS